MNMRLLPLLLAIWAGWSVHSGSTSGLVAKRGKWAAESSRFGRWEKGLALSTARTGIPGDAAPWGAMKLRGGGKVKRKSGVSEEDDETGGDSEGADNFLDMSNAVQDSSGDEETGGPREQDGAGRQKRKTPLRGSARPDSKGGGSRISKSSPRRCHAEEEEEEEEDDESTEDEEEDEEDEEEESSGSKGAAGVLGQSSADEDYGDSLDEIAPTAPAPFRARSIPTPGDTDANGLVEKWFDVGAPKDPSATQPPPPAAAAAGRSMMLGGLDLSVLKVAGKRRRPAIIDLTGGPKKKQAKRGRSEVELSDGESEDNDDEEEVKVKGGKKPGGAKGGDAALPPGLNLRGCLGAAGRGETNAMAVAGEWGLFERVTYTGDLGEWGTPMPGVEVPNVDVDKAFEWVQKGSQRNVSSAIFAVGMCHMVGQFVERDEGVGVAMIARAAKMGNVKAQVYLGHAWAGGVGVGQDADKAVRCWARAAGEGDSEAKAALAEAIATGQGGRAGNDLEKAAELWAEAGAAGDADSWYNLGVIYAGGKAKGGQGKVERNDAMAMRCWRRAAGMGNADAMFNVGMGCLDDGKESSAAKWLARAAYANVPEAMHMLSVLYLTGRGVGEANVRRAFKWAARAADRGVAAAQYNAGVMLTQEGVGGEEERERGRKWLKEAALQGHHEAFMAYASLALEAGQGDEAFEGMEMLMQAAEAGDSEAQYRVGMLKIAQPGGPSKEGEEMLRTAADAGHTDAKAVLAVYLAETGPPEEEGRSSKAVELARQAGGGGGALDPGVWAAGLRRGGMSGMETLAAENVLKSVHGRTALTTAPTSPRAITMRLKQLRSAFTAVAQVSKAGLGMRQTHVRDSHPIAAEGAAAQMHDAGGGGVSEGCNAGRRGPEGEYLERARRIMKKHAKRAAKKRL